MTQPTNLPGTAKVVEIESSWASKINWTQIVALAAMGITVWSGGKYDISPETQVKVVAGIQGVASLLTMVLKTWFSKTITSSSAARM